ncbi:Do family serine endopeptidase [Massilia sp. TS11]|nr:Do family serine endopeptidase [Massilia sp. TS11]MCG2583385.1 Do family serine endopeptidase [Massilia sp. TS11]
MPAQAAEPAASLVSGLPDFTDLIDKVSPAVVNIRTTEKVQRNNAPSEEEMQEFLRRYFGVPGSRQKPAPDQKKKTPQPLPDEEVDRGVGSGFLISADGYVLTNAHVVDGADDVIVTLTDRRELKAKVLGADERTDVALLKVEAKDLPHLSKGDSNKIRVGEWVIAIGSPFNLENTVTAGIISAKMRDTGDYLPLIQSDVAVNPGNSGGPLINMRGEVIGITSQIATISGGYNGISFAVPIDEAMRVAEEIKKSGKVTRGRIGVQIGEVSKEVAEALGMGKLKGVEVTNVEQGGPADKAGLRVGDIILKFNGNVIEKTTDLPRLVGSAAIGSKAALQIWRQGATREMQVAIALADEDKAKRAGKAKAEPVTNALGLQVGDLNEGERKELGISGGVLVEAADGAAARAGIEEGDVILQLNNTEIKDAHQFNALVAKLDPKKGVAVLVRREDQTQFLSIRPRQ